MPMTLAFVLVAVVAVAVVVVMRGGEGMIVAVDEEGEVLLLVVVRFVVGPSGQLMLKKWLWMYSVVEEPLPMVMQKMFVSVRSRSVPTVQVNWEVLERFAGRVLFLKLWCVGGVSGVGKRGREKMVGERKKRKEKNLPTKG